MSKPGWEGEGGDALCETAASTRVDLLTSSFRTFADSPLIGGVVGGIAAAIVVLAVVIVVVIVVVRRRGKSWVSNLLFLAVCLMVQRGSWL